MKPQQLITAANASLEVLELASKQASSERDWLAINRLAAAMTQATGSIETDNDFREPIRDAARLPRVGHVGYMSLSMAKLDNLREVAK